MQGYRTAAERPEEERAPEPPKKPVQVVNVVRYGALWGLLALALIVGSVVLGVANSASFALRCTRAAEGAEPRCDVREREGFSTARASFALTHGAITTSTVLRSETDEVVLRVPGLEGFHAYGDAWAAAAAGGAEAFRVQGARMTWETAASRSTSLVMGVLTAVVFLAFVALMPFRTVLRLDPNTRSASIATRALLYPGHAYDRSFERVEKAVVESIDDSNFMSLCLVENDTPVHLATGDDGSCREAARAINAFLAEMRRARTDAPEGETYFAGWKSMDAAARRARCDMFLASVGIDSGELVPTDKDREIELNGSRRGMPVRLRLGVSPPRDVDLRLTVKSGDGRIVIVQEKGGSGARGERGAKRTYYTDDVFVANRAEAKKLDAMPEDLRARIIRTIADENVSLFAMRPDSIEVHSRQTAKTGDDLVDHVARILDVMTEVALRG